VSRWSPWRRERGARSRSTRGNRLDHGPRPNFYLQIHTHEQILELADELTAPERDYLVVGVTSIPRENVPSIDVDILQCILPIDARIYFIPSGSLTFRLMGLLPDRRAPYNGATRIWMPGADWENDRFSHPQVYDESNEYGPRAIREIAYKLRHALRKSGLSVELDPVDAYRDLEVAQVQRALDRQTAALQRVQAERDTALSRVRISENRERQALHELAQLRSRVLGAAACGRDSPSATDAPSAGADASPAGSDTPAARTNASSDSSQDPVR
jgi:hypothetical protein